ncbi:helicase [Streptomyces tendae]
MTVKLGVWVSSTTSRSDRLDADQLAALAGLGMDRARPVMLTQIAPHSL